MDYHIRETKSVILGSFIGLKNQLNSRKKSTLGLVRNKKISSLKRLNRFVSHSNF